MKRIVAVIKDQPEIETALQEAHQVVARFQQRHEFLHKQMKQVLEESLAHGKTFWGLIERICKERGLYPEGYCEAEHCLEFENDLGLLIARDKRSESGTSKTIEFQLDL